MGGQGAFGVKKIKAQHAAGKSGAQVAKPDLSVEAKPLVEQPKNQFGLTRLGESKPIGPEPVELTGTIPPNRKKPTITLLGEKP